MAGDWIKMRLDLLEDPAVIAMADNLDLREECIVGYCHAFWSWVSRQCHDGTVTGVTLTALGRRLNLPGFPEQLVEVGWLDYDDSGQTPVITIPKFERHLSQSAKQRALATSRQTRKRVTQVSRSKRDKSVTREEKRRVEPSTKVEGKKAASFDALSLDLPFGSSAFAEAWKTWATHRKEIGKPIKAQAAKQQLSFCEGVGEERAVAALQHSTAGSYQGLFEPKSNGQPRKTPVQQLEIE